MQIEGLYVAPMFINVGKFLKEYLDFQILTPIIFVLIIWFYAIYVASKAKRVRKESRSIQTQYEPPKDVSPILAQYLLTAGSQAKMVGDLSVSGLQTLILIDLYENGGLKKIKFIDEVSIEYEVDPDFKNSNLKEEEIKFLDLLIENVGKSATIKEMLDNKGYSKDNGFEEIDKFWFAYWYEYMRDLCVQKDFIHKSKRISILEIFLSIFNVSLLFGVFFSLFILMIPFVGPFLVFIMLFPLVLLFFISSLIEDLIFLILGKDFVLNGVISSVNYLGSIHPIIIVLIFVIIPAFSWFGWALLIPRNFAVAFTKLTKKGKDVLWILSGYRSYLKKVDKDRLTFSLDKDLDYSRNNTTFSWLGFFGLLNDKHWDKFYDAHSDLVS